MLLKSDAEQFERAFDMHISGPVDKCDCGITYWDTYNSGYDWNEGEREALAANPKAIGIPHGVGRILLEGRIYVMDCTCWHARAERIVEWMRSHQGSIGAWFALEKSRLQQAASDVPQIEGEQR